MKREHASTRPTFATADAVHLAGRHWRSTQTPRAAVVLAHGFSASADDPHVAALAEALHARDIDVVSYDARGHGRSGGESTLGDAERHDVAAAVDAARDRNDRVVVVGASMGAIAVLRHAASDPDLAGVVAVSCPSRWRLPRNPLGLLAAVTTRTRLGRSFTARFGRVRVSPRWTDPEPPVALVGRIRAPVALVHGGRDRFIDVRDAHELFDAACEPRRLDVVARMGHAFGPEALHTILDAVDWTLGAVPVPTA